MRGKKIKNSPEVGYCALPLNWSGGRLGIEGGVIFIQIQPLWLEIRIPLGLESEGKFPSQIDIEG